MPDFGLTGSAVVIMHMGYTAWYGIACVFGLWMLLLFSWDRFDQPVPFPPHVARLLPSAISDRSKYIRAFGKYFFMVSVVYGVACVMGPSVLNQVPSGSSDAPEAARATTKEAQPPNQSLDAPEAARATTKEAPPWLPLAIAMAMGGLLPKWRHFDAVEEKLRKHWHNDIGVPGGLTDEEQTIARIELQADWFSKDDLAARARFLRLFMSRQMRVAPPGARGAIQAWLDLGDPEAPLSPFKAHGLTEQDIQFLEALEQLITNARRITSSWYRAKYLMAKLTETAPNLRILDKRVAQDFKPLHTDLLAGFEALTATTIRIREDIGVFELLRDNLAKNPAQDPAALARMEQYLDGLWDNRLKDLIQLRDPVADVLAKAHILIAASYLRRTAGSIHPDALRGLGLNGPAPAPAAALPGPEAHRPHLPAALRDTLSDPLLAMAVLAAASFVFSYAYNLASSNGYPASVAVRTAVSTVVIHGVGLGVAFAWRSRLLARCEWRRSGAGMVRQDLLLAAAAAAAAFVGISLWTWLLVTARTYDPEPLSLQDLATLAVAALGAGVTAMFTVRHLDRAEARPVPASALLARPVLQGLATAAIVLLAAWTQEPGWPADLLVAGWLSGALLGGMVLNMASQRVQPRPEPALMPPGALGAAE